MRFQDLSPEDQRLLQTDLGEFDKVAAEQVALIDEMYTTGFNKLANETADWLDKLAEEEAEKEEEDKMDEEGEKTAAALGAWTERGFFDGLRKLGSDRYGDELHYLYPFLEEKIAGAKQWMKEYVDNTAKHWNDMKAPGKKFLERASSGGKAALRAGGPVAGVAALGYGAKKLNDRRKAKKLEKEAAFSDKVRKWVQNNPRKALALGAGGYTAAVGGLTYAGATNKAKETAGVRAEALGKTIHDATEARKHNLGQYLLNPHVPGPLTEGFARLNRRHLASHAEHPYRTQLIPAYGMIRGGKAGEKEIKNG